MAPDVDPFIAAIEAKIAAWQTVLDSYRAAIALEGQAQEPGIGLAGPRPKGTIDLPVGVFRDKTIREAIQILLEAGRRKQTNKEIAEGLKKGGIASTSSAFEQTVATALFRLRKDGIVLRFDDGWDLAASYPDSLRNRLQAKEQRVPRRRRASKAGATLARRTKPAQDQLTLPDTAQKPEHLRAV